MSLPCPVRANKSETFDCLKFTLDGAGERSDGNARTFAFFFACFTVTALNKRRLVLSRIRAAPRARLGHLAFEGQVAFPCQC